MQPSPPQVAARQRFEESTKCRLWPRLLLALGSILVALVGIEILARLIGWGQMVEFEANESYGFLMRPSQTVYTYGHPVRINSMGLRGPEIQKPKAAGTTRIVFLGDSVTYGGGRIAESQLFCRIIEARGHELGLKIESVNISAPAWSPQNWWKYIERHGLHDADWVILVLPECDLDRAFGTLSRGGHRERVPALRIMSLFLKLKAQLVENDLTLYPSVEESTSANLDAVVRLKDRCNSLKFLAVLVPSRVPQPVNEALWAPFLDELPNALDLREDLRKVAYFSDGSHLNVEGNVFVAEKVFDRMRAMVGPQPGSGINGD
jgi:hypothetical protein